MALKSFSRGVLIIAAGTLLGIPAMGAKTPPVQAVRAKKLAEQLTDIRSRVLNTEQNLLSGAQSKKQVESAMMKIRLLISLQKQEKLLGRKRLAELESTIGELESRRDELKKRVTTQRAALWRLLAGLERSSQIVSENPSGIAETERFEAPKRRVFGNLVSRGVREIEILKADLDDVRQLEARIQDERQHLVYLFQDLNEQESILELNQKIQVENLKRQYQERKAQLEHYRRLKDAEGEVEKLLAEFNARLELDKALTAEREVNRVMFQGAFSKLKGQLALPVAGGKVSSTFGRNFDSKSGLYVFRKGVDVSIRPHQEVRAVFAGKLAFSGELPNYGRVVIVDHGDHFYSLVGHLGELARKVGDSVGGGEILGMADDSGTPIYFEIRARNVAVNPLDWLKSRG